MTRNRYIVVLNDVEWKIEHGGELSARYRTQEEALLDALNAARRLDREGQDAEVLTQSADFGLRMEWTNRLGPLRGRTTGCRIPEACGRGGAFRGCRAARERCHDQDRRRGPHSSRT